MIENREHKNFDTFFHNMENVPGFSDKSITHGQDQKGIDRLMKTIKTRRLKKILAVLVAVSCVMLLSIFVVDGYSNFGRGNNNGNDNVGNFNGNGNTGSDNGNSNIGNSNGNSNMGDDNGNKNVGDGYGNVNTGDNNGNNNVGDSCGNVTTGDNNGNNVDDGYENVNTGDNNGNNNVGGFYRSMMISRILR